jgi:DNA gyrase subunit B
MLSSDQVGTLITALGAGIGRADAEQGGFNLAKLRYHKIIIMTDADVDGAHIRTLLLTFFYRQMPELIDAGHLFIAQPPLYKAARGKSHVYLKDERALEEYLVDSTLDGATFRTSEGVERGGADLRVLIEEARNVRNALAQLHSRYDRRVVEQMAIAGVLHPISEDDEAKANEAAAYVARRLDAISDELERGWEGKVSEGGFVFSRMIRGVKQAATIDAGLLASTEARKLDAAATSLQEAYAKPGVLSRKGDTFTVNGPSDLFDAVSSIGKKGVSLQRYKGLGEMNPDQLWETTLDRDVRSLLRVKNDQNDEADDLFVKLMGDVVEPRREFIQTNALNATVDI